MVDLIKLISEEEKGKINNYIAYCAGNPTCDIEYLLRLWNKEKQDLFKLLGENLIIKKDVVFTKNIDVISSEIGKSFRYRFGDSSLAAKFFHDYDEYIRQYYDPWKTLERNKDGFYPCYSEAMDSEEFKKMSEVKSCLNLLASTEFLATNRYEGNSVKIPLPEGKSLTVNRGAKVSRVLGKLAAAWGLDGYEDFRLKHSLILNEKILKGTLCLSIHPLDYMTMSDNNYDWSSCMSWVERGDYCLGPTEMMNSKIVLEAYLEADEPFSLPDTDFEWNNKKWRELFIVDENMIFGVKGYPYWNRELEKSVLEWVKVLAKENCGWEYSNELFEFDGGDEAAYHIGTSDQVSTFYFSTGYMYNDIYSIHYCFLNDYMLTKENLLEINFSSFPECMICGSVDDFYGEDANRIICDSCRPGFECEWCGCYNDDEPYAIVDDRAICQDCYENDTSYCKACEETHMNENMYVIEIVADDEVDPDEGELEVIGEGCICDNCYDAGSILKSGSFKSFYKHWHWTRYIGKDKLNQLGLDLLNDEWNLRN